MSKSTNEEGIGALFCAGTGPMRRALPCAGPAGCLSLSKHISQSTRSGFTGGKQHSNALSRNAALAIICTGNCDRYTGFQFTRGSAFVLNDLRRSVQCEGIVRALRIGYGKHAAGHLADCACDIATAGGASSSVGTLPASETARVSGLTGAATRCTVAAKGPSAGASAGYSIAQKHNARGCVKARPLGHGDGDE